MRVLFRRVRTVAVIAATVVLCACLSDVLPVGRELHALVGWLGLSELALPLASVWGKLAALVVPFPFASLSLKMAILSLAAAVIGVALLAYVVDRLMRLAVAQAAEADYLSATDGAWLPVAAVLCATAAFLLSPGFLCAATRCSSVPAEIVLAFSALALAVRCGDTERSRPGLAGVIAVGTLAGTASLQGAVGLALAPLALAVLCLAPVRKEAGAVEIGLGFLVGTAVGIVSVAVCLFDSPGTELPQVALSNLRLLRHTFADSGLLAFLLGAILPVAALFDATRRGLIRTAKGFGRFFGLWGVALTGLGVLMAFSGALSPGRAEALFVDDLIRDLDGRKWLVSDGALDDLLLCRIPQDTHLVSLAREGDVAYARQLVRWTDELPDADDDLRFAADLGPMAFVDEWFDRYASATNLADTCLLRFVRPCADWEARCDRLAPYLSDRKSPAVGYVKRYLGAQGNAVAAERQKGGDKAAAWRLYWRILDEIDECNLSAMLNLSEMVDVGYPATDAEKAKLVELRNDVRRQVRDAATLRRAVSLCGRLYADPARIEKFVDKEKERRRQAEQSESMSRLKDIEERFRSARTAAGEERAKAVSEIELDALPELRRECGKRAPWLVHLVQGDLYALKGSRYREKAAVSYREAFEDESCPLNAVASGLLSADIALGDADGLERDALKVLRRNRHHVLANSLMGALRLKQGDLDSSERFLRKAVSDSGHLVPGALNDLACVALRRGDLDGAEKYARSAVAAKPDDWNFSETLVQALIARGKVKEAGERLSLTEKLAERAHQQEAAAKVLEGDRENLEKAKGE